MGQCKRIVSPCDADMAQLVEHHLAKVGVAGSNPVVRSRTSKRPVMIEWPAFLTKSLRMVGDVAKW